MIGFHSFHFVSTRRVARRLAVPQPKTLGPLGAPPESADPLFFFLGLLSCLFVVVFVVINQRVVFVWWIPLRLTKRTSSPTLRPETVFAADDSLTGFSEFPRKTSDQFWIPTWGTFNFENADARVIRTVLGI